MMPESNDVNFLTDSEILASEGDWHLVVYDSRAIALVSDGGSSIESPMCLVPDMNDGSVHPAGKLLEKLGDLYVERDKKASERLDDINLNDAVINKLKLDRRTLLDKAWAASVGLDAADNTITRLTRKLEEANKPIEIERHVGYVELQQKLHDLTLSNRQTEAELELAKDQLDKICEGDYDYAHPITIKEVIHAFISIDYFCGDGSMQGYQRLKKISEDYATDDIDATDIDDDDCAVMHNFDHLSAKGLIDVIDREARCMFDFTMNAIVPRVMGHVEHFIDKEVDRHGIYHWTDPQVKEVKQRILSE
jgi:hypothetical protein